ncbi:MAG: SDR family NAD(P)-dependent oxidoreductase [Clostridia bacterium]|nr:SDR family NAD(P)-dependent oxidoreductase [Clostridia bacterium]
MSSDRLTALITGAGSGIGYETARLLQEKGWEVWDLSRRDRCPQGVKHMSCDIADESTVKTCVNCIASASGHIDLLINNAGCGISGAAEFTDAEDSARMMGVNLFGTDNVTRAVIPHMRANGSGRIIFISSAAAIFAIPFQAWYSASKFAINAYALALRNELAPFKIDVCALMPGDIRTGFTASRVKSSAGSEIYGGRIEKAVGAMERDEQNGLSPEYAAQRILKTVYAKKPKPLSCIGFKYSVFAVINKILPIRIVNFLVGKLY